MTNNKKNQLQKLKKDYGEEDEDDKQEDAKQDIKDIIGKQFKKKSTVDSAVARSIPPHKRFRKLRLFDTPHTPKSLIKKSHLVLNVQESKLITIKIEEKYKSLESCNNNHIESSQFVQDILKNATSKDSTPEKKKSSPTNINEKFVSLYSHEKFKIEKDLFFKYAKIVLFYLKPHQSGYNKCENHRLTFLGQSVYMEIIFWKF